MESVAGSVDDVVVVDTGSLDDTAEQARDLGARVYSFQWLNDFSAARNFALSKCATEWALYIDADEQLESGSWGNVKGQIDPCWYAADVLLRPKRNYTRCRLSRLFRIDPRIRFEGAIHETILPSLRGLPDIESHVGLTSVKVDHLGYDGDITVKHVRNLPLLRRCVEEYPDRVYYWSHLAETLLAFGDFEGAYAAGRNGIEAARRNPSARSATDASVICQMISAHMLTQGTDPDDFIREGLAFHGQNYGLLLAQAQRDQVFGNVDVALGIARHLQTVDPESIIPGHLAYDIEIFGRHTIELEVACLRRKGNFREAVSVLLDKAGRLSP